MSVIYKITNKINNKLYIGKTESKNYIKYIKGHFKEAKNIDNNKILYKAIRKYGKNNFEVDIIWKGKYKGKAIGRLEIFFVSQYGSFLKGYNMTKGGEGCDWSGKHHSEESKRKIAKFRKGMIPWNKGKKLSEEHCRNISKNHANISGKNHPNFGKHFYGNFSFNKKRWLLIDPFKNVYYICGTLNKFIEKNNLSRSILYNNLGKIVPKYIRGNKTKKRINTTNWILIRENIKCQ